MTNFSAWCGTPTTIAVGSHVLDVLICKDDAAGMAAVAESLPERYADSSALALIADRHGKPGVASFLRNKIPTSQRGRSGDLGEILASAYIEEERDYVVGPSRLVHRDHQEWAMRGDDVLAAKLDDTSDVFLLKAESKSRATAQPAVIAEARDGLQRNNGLPSPHSLTQFAERLLDTAAQDLGDAVLSLILKEGIRPSRVTHLMFLFAGNDPTEHVKGDLSAYKGKIAQQAVVVRVPQHQAFIRGRTKQR